MSEARSFTDRVPETVEDIRRRVERLTGRDVGDLGDRAQAAVEALLDAGTITTITTSVIGTLAGVVLVLITALYMAINPRLLITGMLRLFPPATGPGPST